MKISLHWLSQYLDGMPEPQVVADILTAIGLEVEGMTDYCSHPGGLEGLVVGEVVECFPHPNADKLRLTKVNIGSVEALPIVCGAPNVAAGQKVVVAPVGCTLYPAGGEPFEIKKAKIRGEVSEGMLCAEDEIGLGSSHEGILVLPAETTVGSRVADYFGVTRDTVLEIGLTPNRSDAFSHLGVARDLHAACSTRGISTRLRLPELPAFTALPHSNSSFEIAVNVENTEACPRYSGIALDDIVVGPSPEWMQKRLSAIGVRPINNVVDITNFILHEYGQPLHAFDADKIAGSALHIGTRPAGSPFVSLDGVTRSLHADDLMINDTEKPLCMAGIYGGLDSGVSASTKRLFLESATFHARWIRRSFTRHGLRTDAAAHYEKGTDINITVTALQRAAGLLAEYAHATVAADPVDVYPNPWNPEPIRLRWDRLNSLIGTIIPKQEVHDILGRLQMQTSAEDESGMLVLAPSDKTDVTREVDVVEEILRIYGMDRIPLPASLHSNIVAVRADTREQARYHTARFLNGCGFTEIFSNPITRSTYLETEHTATRQAEAVSAAGYLPDQVVRLANSLNAELDVMRPDLIYGGLESLVYNINRRRSNLRLFEFGRVFSASSRSKQKESISDTDTELTENEQLGLWLCGESHEPSWRKAAESTDFFDLKSTVHQVLDRCGVAWTASAETTHPCLDFGLDYFLDGQKTVSFGRVGKALASRFDLRIPVYYAAFSWDFLMSARENRKLSYRALSRFPAVRRDLALVLDEAIAYGEVERIARQRGGKWLREVFLFDAYQGDNLGQGRKSYGIGLSFRDDQSTLTDKQVDQIMQQLIGAYEKELNATIRR